MFKSDEFEEITSFYNYPIMFKSLLPDKPSFEKQGFIDNGREIIPFDENARLSLAKEVIQKQKYFGSQKSDSESRNRYKSVKEMIDEVVNER